MDLERRDYRTAGQKKGGRHRTYLDRHRTMRKAVRGWRSSGFRLGGGHEAYDAELAAMVYGLAHLHGRAEQGHTYTIFTDSTAAMRRVMGDAPGPGQDMAIRAIDIAERIARMNYTVSIRWSPAHRGIEGNERANRAAKDAATLPPLGPTVGRFSLAFLGRGVTERMSERWVRDIRTRTKDGREGR